MKASDRALMAGLGLVVLAIAFWVAILGPKRGDASDLSDQITQLQASVSQMEQTAADAQQERDHFAASYHKLVVLGKAVPADSDQSSLLVQLNSLSTKAGVDFENLDLTSDTAGAAAAASQVQTQALLQPGTAP
jgi:type II secretory pathway component PulM